MIAVIIPVHNEAARLAACLRNVAAAAMHPGLEGEEVMVVTVLNGCTDRSEAIAQGFGVTVLQMESAHVGLARRAGCDHAIERDARWLAMTDADTLVASDWLEQQLMLGASVVCGTVEVDDWSCHGPHASALQRHFDATYTDRDGHRHIHGANLGLLSSAYLAVGGFPALRCSEDVALVEALDAAGFDICWSRRPRVLTSARVNARARGGFGDTLVEVVSRIEAFVGSGLEPA